MSSATKDMMQSSRGGGSQVPSAIIERLQSLLKRIRRVILLRGLLGVAAMAMGVVLALIALDTMALIESMAVRAVLSLAGAALVGAAAYWFVIRPLHRPLSMTMVARMVEEHHPELQERISSAFELLTAPQGRGSRGSEQLIAALAAEATLDVGKVDPKREVGTRSVLPYLYAAVGMLAIFLLILVIWPTATARALLRMVRPTMNTGNVLSLSLQVEPGTRTIARETPLTITVRHESKEITSASLRRTDSAGQHAVLAMAPVGDDKQAMSYHFDSVLDDFTYQIQVGRALTKEYQITVVEAPVIKELRIRYEYPPYTGLASTELVDQARTIIGPIGTAVSIAVTAEERVQSAELQLGDQKLPAAVEQVNGTSLLRWTLSLEKGMAPSATIVLVDKSGVQSKPETLEIKPIEDRAPLVEITEPVVTKKITVKPTDLITIHSDILEDYKVAKVQLLVSADGAAPQLLDGPLATIKNPEATNLAERRWHGKTPLKLSGLKLAGVKQLAVRVRVFDNRDKKFGGPQYGDSSPLIVALDQAANPYDKQKTHDQLEEFKQAILPILADLKATHPMLQASMPKVAVAGALPPEAKKELEAIGLRTSGASQKLAAIAERFMETTVAPLAAEVGKIASGPLPDTNKALDAAQLAPAPAERTEKTKLAETNLLKAIERLQKVIDEMPKHEKMLEKLHELERLAERQNAELQELLKQAEAMKEKTELDMQPKTEPWREEQKQIAAELGNQVKQDPALLAAALKDAAATAGKLSDEAKVVATRQDEVRDIVNKLADPHAKRDDVKAAILEAIKKAEKDIAGEIKKVQEKADQNPQLQAKLEKAQGEIGKTLEAIDNKQLPQAAAEANKAEDTLKPEQNPQGQQPEGQQPMDQQPEGQQPMAQQPEGQQPMGQQPMGQQPMGQQPMGQQPMGQQPMGQQPMGQQPMGQQPMGQQPMGEQPQSEPGEQPVPSEPLAPELAELQEQQEAIAGALEELAAGDLEEALQGLEDQLNQRAEELAELAMELQAEAQQLNQPPSDAAAKLAEAEAKTAEAENQLAMASPMESMMMMGMGEMMGMKMGMMMGMGMDMGMGGMGGMAPPMAPMPSMAPSGMAPPEPGKGSGTAPPGPPGPPAPPGPPGGMGPPMGAGGMGMSMGMGMPGMGMMGMGMPMGMGQPNPMALAAAAMAQQQASQALREAADKLTALQNQLAAAAPLPAPMGQQASAPLPAPLAEAFSSAVEASQAQAPADAIPAAAEAAAALDSAVAAAAAAAGVPGVAAAGAPGQTPPMGPGSPTPGPAGPYGGRKAGAGVMTTKDPGTKVDGHHSDWVRFSGRIQSNATEASASDTPPEYRDVVNRYFRELSKRGAQVDGSR